MSDAGRHRHVSIARRVTLPSVIIVAAFVAAAVVIGEVNLLRASALSALVVGIAIAVLFDQELIRDRREHGRDRVNLARAYAVEYGGWIDDRVSTEASAPMLVDAVLVDEAELADEVDDADDAEVEITADADTDTDVEADADTEAVAEVEAAVETDIDADADTDADAGAGDMWSDFAEAPTVVNLAIWEERSRETASESDGTENAADIEAHDIEAREDADEDDRQLA